MPLIVGALRLPTWIGTVTRYLYPLNLNMIALATEADEDMRRELRAEVNTRLYMGSIRQS